MKENVYQLFKMLDKKNSYLREFYDVNAREIKRLVRGEFDKLETFYYSRELILNAIERIDKQLKTNKLIQEPSISNQDRIRLKEIFKLKQNMVLSILDQDMAIFSMVEKGENQTELKKAG